MYIFLISTASTSASSPEMQPTIRHTLPLAACLESNFLEISLRPLTLSKKGELRKNPLKHIKMCTITQGIKKADTRGTQIHIYVKVKQFHYRP